MWALLLWAAKSVPPNCIDKLCNPPIRLWDFIIKIWFQVEMCYLMSQCVTFGQSESFSSLCWSSSTCNFSCWSSRTCSFSCWSSRTCSFSCWSSRTRSFSCWSSSTCCLHRLIALLLLHAIHGGTVKPHHESNVSAFGFTLRLDSRNM